MPSCLTDARPTARALLGPGPHFQGGDHRFVFFRISSVQKARGPISPVGSRTRAYPQVDSRCWCHHAASRVLLGGVAKVSRRAGYPMGRWDALYRQTDPLGFRLGPFEYAPMNLRRLKLNPRVGRKRRFARGLSLRRHWAIHRRIFSKGQGQQFQGARLAIENIRLALSSSGNLSACGSHLRARPSCLATPPRRSALAAW